MNQSLTAFQFHTFILDVIDRNGEPLFIARPLVEFLGYQNPAEAIRTNVDEEDIEKIYIPEKSNNYVCVNESGLYSLVLRSSKPEAKTFKRWVTNEVLPAIRKTGSYSVKPIDPIQLLNDPETLRTLLLTHVTENIELKKENAVIKPKAEALDRLSAAEGSQCITDAAKALKIPPKDLFKKLHAMRWIYKRTGGKNWLGYQDKIRSGLVEHKITTVSKSDGGEKVTEQVLLTGKGISEISKILNAETQQKDIFH
jgi:anti-repressor protein